MLIKKINANKQKKKQTINPLSKCYDRAVFFFVQIVIKNVGLGSFL